MEERNICNLYFLSEVILFSGCNLNSYYAENSRIMFYQLSKVESQIRRYLYHWFNITVLASIFILGGQYLTYLSHLKNSHMHVSHKIFVYIPMLITHINGSIRPPFWIQKVLKLTSVNTCPALCKLLVELDLELYPEPSLGVYTEREEEELGEVP